MTVICKGTTRSGHPCRCKVRCGEYCGYHCYQKPIEFYPTLENWPTSLVINKSRSGTHSVGFIPLVLIQLANFKMDMLVQPSPMFYPESQIKYSHRLFLIKSIELIKRNACICYGEPTIDRLIIAYCEKLYEIPEFKDYVEDFKKRCLKSHRDQARKKVYTFYLNFLCNDIIEKIISYC